MASNGCLSLASQDNKKEDKKKDRSRSRSREKKHRYGQIPCSTLHVHVGLEWPREKREARLSFRSRFMCEGIIFLPPYSILT